MARSGCTLDDAAVELMQLVASDNIGVRKLRDRLKRLARKAGSASTKVEAAAAALGGLLRGMDGDAALAEAGRCLEAAMQQQEVAGTVAGDDEADDLWVGSAPASAAPAGFAIDPLMLAALAALDAEEAAEAAARAPSAVVVAPALAERTPAGRAAETQPENDAELIEGFIAESDEYLRSAEESLLQLESGSFDVESINGIFRCFHTIKGTSAFLGLEKTCELAHRAESLLSRVRDRTLKLEGAVADLALRSVDMLGALVRGVGGARRPGAQPTQGYAELLAELEAAALAESNADVAAATRAQAKSAGEASRGVEASSPAAMEGSAEPFTRVRTDRLDRLLDAIGELVIAHAMIAEADSVAQGDGLSRKVTHAGKIVRELQDLGMTMRLVPMKALFQKLARLCRDTARKSGKWVEFVTEGEDTELDRNMVEMIGDALVHMLRNAVDHGLESGAERQQAGKPARGTVRLTAKHAGGSVVLTLGDDGRGLDRERIRAQAVARGLIAEDHVPADSEIHKLIFAPGLSTVETVTDLSGRGVGLDVVRRNVEALHGRIEIVSAAGRGTTFTISLPLTLAITDGMLVRVGSERYIVPTVSIDLSFRPARESLSTVAGRGEMVLLRDQVLPILRLHEVLGVPGAATDPTEALLLVVVSGERRTALLVDELLGQQQVVAKALGAGVGKISGISGGAILGDGRVGLILNVNELLSVSRFSARSTSAGEHRAA